MHVVIYLVWKLSLQLFVMLCHISLTNQSTRNQFNFDAENTKRFYFDSCLHTYELHLSSSMRHSKQIKCFIVEATYLTCVRVFKFQNTCWDFWDFRQNYTTNIMKSQRHLGSPSMLNLWFVWILSNHRYDTYSWNCEFYDSSSIAV